jgi:hypothetical protein
LSGHATQVFIGWDIPAGAKPIYYKVGNRTITRYEGATNKYAAYVDLQDKEGKYKLHGEFYKDGTGGIVGKVMKNGVECDIGLLGSSISMYENVSSTENLSTSEEEITEKLNNSNNNNSENNNGNRSNINNSNGNKSSEKSLAPDFELTGNLVCLYCGWRLRKI